MPLVIEASHRRSLIHKETEKFSLFQSDLQLVNQYVITSSSDSGFVSYGIVKDNGKITGMIGYSQHSEQGTEIELDTGILDALNHIYHHLIERDFSFIDISAERITYGGLGNRMYVFSRNGNRPKYFYFPGDARNDNFKTYHLKDNWYLLTFSSR